MRHTEPDQSVLEIPLNEVWLGVIQTPTPHVVLAFGLDNEDEDDELRVLTRLAPGQAREMGEEMARLANTLTAPNN